jgi:hypothetical protein
MPDSRREQILDALVTHFKGMATPTYTFVPGSTGVVRRRLMDADRKKEYMLSILDVEEDKVALIRQFDCALHVELEFWALVSVSDDPPSKMNQFLADLQKSYRKTIVSGGALESLVENIVEVRNEVDTESEHDRQLSGMLVLDVRYRHALDDPSAFN